MVSLQFEYDRLKRNKKIIFLYILLFLFAIASVYQGIEQYNSFKIEKENFDEYEKLSVKQYKNYQDYGNKGIRILNDKSPLCILFKISALKETTNGHFDTSEIIEVSNSRRGKSRFVNNKNLIDGFGDIIYLFGSLLVLYLGVTAFDGINNLKLYKKLIPLMLSIFNRMLISGLYFSLLFVIAYLALPVSGITLTGVEFNAYMYYSVYTLCLLFLFFISGVTIAVLNASAKRQDMKYFYAPLVWLLMIVGIPFISANYISFRANDIQSIGELYLDKFKRLQNFEKEAEKKYFDLMKKENANSSEIAKGIVRDYQNRIFPENILKEKNYINKVKRVMQVDENRALIFPTTYHQFLSNEISGDGHYAYLEFMDYTLKLWESFFKYYIRKRYYSQDKTVESFVKADQNIFESRPVIPRSFSKGLGILFLYGLVIVLTFILRILAILKGNARDKQNRPGWKLTNRQFYFKYINDHKERRSIYRSFEVDKKVSCLSKLDFNDMEKEGNISVDKLLAHWCKTRGVPLKKVEKYLFVLGEDISKLRFNRAELDSLFFKKLYLAVVFSEDNDLIVMDDFIKNEDKEFDLRFRELEQMKVADGNTIIYLSSIMPETENKKALLKKRVQEKDLVDVEPTELSFR